MYTQRKYPQRKKLAQRAAPVSRAPARFPQRKSVVSRRTKAVGRPVYSLANRARVAPRSRYTRSPHRYGKSKKMIEGPPTLLDRIASGVGSVARLASAVAPMIEMINTEAKFYDRAAASTFTNTGTLVNLTNLIPQGTDESERIGNSILLKDMQLKLFLSHPIDYSTSTSNGGYWRVILFCWKENLQDNPPTVAKLLQGSTFSAFTNKDYTDQFVILKDKIMSFETDSSRTTGVVTNIFRFLKWYKKADWHLRFDGGTTADGTQNHVYIVLISSVSTNSNYTLNFRMNYTDN